MLAIEFSDIKLEVSGKYLRVFCDDSDIDTIINIAKPMPRVISAGQMTEDGVNQVMIKFDRRAVYDDILAVKTAIIAGV